MNRLVHKRQRKFIVATLFTPSRPDSNRARPVAHEVKRGALGVLSDAPLTLVITTLTVTALACVSEIDPPSDISTPPSVRDSVGIEIVENGAPFWTDETRWIVDSQPEITIRTPSGNSDPPFVLFNVGDVRPLSDGRIVIENQGTEELFVMDSVGSHVSTWGGDGEGPGEFSRMSRLFRCPGDVLIAQESDRATTLDGNGVVLAVQRNPPVGARTVAFEGVAMGCEKVLWVWGDASDTYRDSPRGTTWGVRRFAWVPLGDGSVDTVGVFFDFEVGDERQAIPFALTSDWSTDGESVFYGVGDIPEVKVFDATGKILRLIRWNATPQVIRESDWATYQEQWDRLVEYTPSAERFRSSPELLPFDSMPLFARGAIGGGDFLRAVQHDAEGHLWVSQYQPVPWDRRVPSFRHRPLPPQRWWIFNREGRLLGELDTPENLLIRSVEGGKIYGVSSDEFGVEEVRVYRIRKPAG